MEKRYDVDDAEKKKITVDQWIKFQIIDDNPIMKQVHEYENLTVDVLNENMEMCDIFQDSVLLPIFE